MSAHSHPGTTNLRVLRYSSLGWSCLVGVRTALLMLQATPGVKRWTVLDTVTGYQVIIF